MTKRVITGTLYTIVILAGIYFGGVGMTALISLAMLISMHEIYAALKLKEKDISRVPGYMYSIMIIVAQFLPQLFAERLMLFAPVVCVLAAAIIYVLRGKIAAKELILSVFPVLYPGIFFVMLLSCAQLQGKAVNMTALCVAFFSASINDAFALFTGMACGRHKLSPVISPKKTIEGSVGGLIACILFTVFLPDILRLFFSFNAELIATMDQLPPKWILALAGLIVGVLSQIGDLTASMIKRGCGIKDYGHILPGHGGVLDRLDGVLFCGAACYFVFTISGIA